MKATKCALLLAMLGVSSSSVAAQSPGMIVSHFEQLQELKITQSATTGVQKTGLAAASGLRFDAMGRTFDLHLESNSRLLSAASMDDLSAGIQLLRGSIDGVAGSWARIVLANGVPRGLIWDGTEMYAVEAPGDSAVSSTQAVIYRLADAYSAPGAMSCGAGDPTGNAGAAFSKLVGEISTAVMQAPGATTQLNLGAIGDSSFVAVHGADADAAIATRLNNVDGIFSEQLGIQLQVQELELFDAASDPFSTPTDPDSGETDSTDLLNDLADYRQATAIQNAQGLTHLYTGRDLVGTTVGVAYNSAICSSRFGVGLSEGIRGATTDSLIAVHEIGHNFGAPHDGVTGPCESEVGDFIMSTMVNGSDQFSACSIAEMQPVIAAANCFVPLPGSDISIAPATPPQVALLGNSATTNFSVRNNGTDDAQNVSVDITIPPIADIVSVSATTGTCTSGAGSANCQLGVVAGGGSHTVVLSTLTSSVGIDSFLATVSATVDDSAGNNQANVQLTVNPAVDMAVSVGSTAQVAETQSINVTIGVDNNSSLDASNVLLGVSLDPGLTINSANWSAGSCSINAQQVDCQAAAVGSQAVTSVTIGVTGALAGRHNYDITVSSDEDDRDVANNSITGVVSVNSPQAEEEESGGGAAGLVSLLFLMLASASRRSRRFRR